MAISSVPAEAGQFWQLALFVITLITRLVLIKKLCLKDDIPSPSGSDIAEGGGTSGDSTGICSSGTTEHGIGRAPKPVGAPPEADQ